MGLLFFLLSIIYLQQSMLVTYSNYVSPQFNDVLDKIITYYPILAGAVCAQVRFTPRQAPLVSNMIIRKRLAGPKFKFSFFKSSWKFKYHYAFPNVKSPNEQQPTREMEVAGTVLAVTGIVGLFNTALEVFDYVQSAAAFGTTHEVLQVKIEVEKVRLLIWGQSIGMDGSADQRDDAVNEALDREYLRTAVAGLLVCFVKIFEDSEKLRDRYGLVLRVDPGTGTGMETENLDQRLLGSTFKRTYDKFRGNPSKRQKDSTLALKIRWAVADEKHFRRLVEDLKAINDSLNHLMPAIRDKTRVRMRTEIMQSTDEHQLQNLANAFDDVNDLVSETASLRLEMLSGRGVSNQPSPATVRNSALARRPVSISHPGPSAQTSRSSAAVATDAPVSEALATETKKATVTPTPVAPVAPAPPKSPPPKRLSIPAGPPYDNTGALIIHKVFFTAEVPSFFSWQVNVEDLGQAAPKRESILNIAFGKLLPNAQTRLFSKSRQTCSSHQISSTAASYSSKST